MRSQVFYIFAAIAAASLLWAAFERRRRRGAPDDRVAPPEPPESPEKPAPPSPESPRERKKRRAKAPRAGPESTAAALQRVEAKLDAILAAPTPLDAVVTRDAEGTESSPDAYCGLGAAYSVDDRQ